MLAENMRTHALTEFIWITNRHELTSFELSNIIYHSRRRVWRLTWLIYQLQATVFIITIWTQNATPRKSNSRLFNVNIQSVRSNKSAFMNMTESANPDTSWYRAMA